MVTWEVKVKEDSIFEYMKGAINHRDFEDNH